MQLATRPVSELSRLALVLVAGCAGQRPAAQIGVGDTLDFRLPNLRGGVLSPKDLIGKVVLVDLWATWCKPCKVSLPFYKTLVEQRGKDGFTVVAISVDVHQDEVERFISTQGLPFTVLLDPRGSVPEKIGISTLPTMLLIGRDGKIAFLHPGFEESDQPRISEVVDRALAVATSSIAPGERPK